MCKKLLMLCLVLGFASGAWAAYEGPIDLTSGREPVLEWSLEDNQLDTSGNDYDAGGSHSGYSADTAGGAWAGSKSADFDGVDDKILKFTGMPLLPVGHTDAFTLNVLIKTTKADSAGRYAGMFGFGAMDTNYSSRAISPSSGSGGNSARAYYVEGALGKRLGYWIENEWNMLTVTSRWRATQSGTTATGWVQTYINGVLHGSDTSMRRDTSYEYAAMGEFKVKAYNAAYYDGLSDEFTVWDEELSATDVAELWAGYTPEPATIALLGLGGLALLRKKRS